ncbi:Acyl-protein thioesterase 1 [Colletotrichum orbiculare MAFF 240422]|uniref:Acyl-protein thioesterase 1 n=1 Tax=Colletotrichum orbiculare (strain 104-T / ATCC 96160 / CBS 514.97 / LARS 414 / MAFF 240422) TaxID=1213857 RepID=N4VG10_COLOR|nr:Acyl-protein thioesterase 1 [Colletotrichum orbiculare MAFF 240422]
MSFELHIVDPAAGHAHTHTVILLHGRDSKCQEFADELFESEASQPEGGPRTLRDLFPTVKWVFPGAAVISSKRFGMPMSQWFDVWSVENPDERPELQEQGLRDSTRFVLGILERESAVVARERIFLGGISQGFAAALATFFAGGGSGVAGLIGLCSWSLPELSRVAYEDAGEGDSPDARRRRLQSYFGAGLEGGLSEPREAATPVFLGHAIDDDVVPVENGRRLRLALEKVLGPVTWREYESGGHWVNEPEGVDDIVEWLRLNMHRTRV